MFHGLSLPTSPRPQPCLSLPCREPSAGCGGVAGICAWGACVPGVVCSRVSVCPMWVHVPCGYVSHVGACPMRLHVLCGCVSHVGACATWLCVPYGCMSHVVMCPTWLRVPCGCVSHVGTCATWLHVLCGCMPHVVVCPRWMCVPRGCMSCVGAGYTLPPPGYTFLTGPLSKSHRWRERPRRERRCEVHLLRLWTHRNEVGSTLPLPCDLSGATFPRPHVLPESPVAVGAPLVDTAAALSALWGLN